MRGFDENQKSLYIGSLSEPIAVQVTPRQVNIVNRFTGTLLSEWRAPGYQLNSTSNLFSLAITVGAYICVLQNRDTIYLHSCETPSVGTTNNRLRKICLELEHTKELSDEINCWDSLTLPKPIKLSTNVKINPNQSQNDDVNMVDAKNSPNHDDSMVDIWEDICMEASMGAPSIPVEMEEQENENLSDLEIEGFIIAYLRKSHSIVLYSAPTLSTLITYSLGSNIPSCFSVVLFSNDLNNFNNIRVLLGLVDGSVLGISIEINPESISFKHSSLIRTNFSHKTKPKPCRLFKLPSNFLNNNSENMNGNVANILLSTDTNQILECTTNEDFK